MSTGNPHTLGILLARGPDAPEAGWAIGLARAAARQGARVEVFLTAEGVDVLGSPRLEEFGVPGVRVSACTRSVVERGARADADGVDYSSQFELGRIVARVDRFVSFS